MTLENLKDFDRTLFGTKVLNLETKKLGIVLYTWTNVYADGNIPFATCVNENGKRYNIEMELMGCKFLFSLYVPRDNGKTSEIDVIMLHPKGLFVIESKNCSGWISEINNYTITPELMDEAYNKLPV